jgi:hypothetical protein
MQQLVLNIEESRYTLLVQFLKTLDYVKVVQAPTDNPPKISSKNASQPGNQLAHLREVLQKQTRPLFQDITDPLAWQKQQRDEWS